MEFFQFCSCFWHSCSFCDTSKNSDGSLQEMHPVKKKSHSEICKETLENKRWLESESFAGVEMPECQWKQK